MQTSVHAPHLITVNLGTKKLFNRGIVLQMQLIGEHELSVKHYFSSKMLFLCTVNVKRISFLLYFKLMCSILR